MVTMTTTALDRFARWNLDFDGDLYGSDERERLRWYEGTALSYGVQSVALPWAAAVLIWPLGRAAILPLAVLLALQVLSMTLASVYVAGRRVDTVPRRWTAKRILLQALTGAPFVVFMIGAMRAWQPDSNMWLGGLVGAVIGGAGGVAGVAIQLRNRRRRDAVPVRDED
jgi:hypothetical protein